MNNAFELPSREEVRTDVLWRGVLTGMLINTPLHPSEEGDRTGRH